MIYENYLSKCCDRKFTYTWYDINYSLGYSLLKQNKKEGEQYFLKAREIGDKYDYDEYENEIRCYFKKEDEESDLTEKREYAYDSGD